MDRHRLVRHGIGAHHRRVRMNDGAYVWTELVNHRVHADNLGRSRRELAFEHAAVQVQHGQRLRRLTIK